jgi:ribulose 1,5-bisphosphate synthetase/thiazole synthase
MNYYTADSVESISTLISRSTQAGLMIFHCISAEDVLMRKSRVTGLVLNCSVVKIARLHVDLLAVPQFIVEATGHETTIVRLVQDKIPGNLSLLSKGRIALVCFRSAFYPYYR